MASNSTETPGQVDNLLRDGLKPTKESEWVWKKTIYSDVWKFLLLGGINSYMRHSSSTVPVDTKDHMDLVFSVIDSGKGLDLLNLIDKVYKEGLAVHDDTVIFALSVCTCSEIMDVKTAAYNYLHEICEQSSNFLQFIHFHSKVCKMKRSTTGWSRGHKKAVQRWYCRKPALEMAPVLTRCMKKCGWSHKDVMKLCHVRMPSQDQQTLAHFICTGLKQTSEKLAKVKTEKQDENSKTILDYLQKVSKVRSSSDATTIVPVYKELNLTWDYIPTQLYSNKGLWQGLLSYLPLEVVIPNACTLAKLGLLDENAPEKAIFINRCKEAAAVKASKLHPYSILLQREVFNNSTKDSQNKLPWKNDNEVIGAMNTAFEIAVANLVPTGKRFFITIDASSSMKANIINNNYMKCRVAAACMALCIAKTEREAIVMAFSKELADIKVNRNTTLEDIVNSLEKTPLGGTDCAWPIIFAKNKKIKIDIFIIFTDKETWCGKTTPAEALHQYRKALKIPAKLIVIALNSDEKVLTKTVADPNDRGMLDIYGFSPTIPKILHNFAKFNF